MLVLVEGSGLLTRPMWGSGLAPLVTPAPPLPCCWVRRSAPTVADDPSGVYSPAAESAAVDLPEESFGSFVNVVLSAVPLPLETRSLPPK